MGWLIGLEPTAFWATRRKASRRAATATTRQAKEERGSGQNYCHEQAECGAERRFFAESSTFKAKKSEVRLRAPP